MTIDSPPHNPPLGLEETPRKYESGTLSIGRTANHPQCRLQATEDLTGQFVMVDHARDFLDAFLPLPPDAPACPVHATNPFATLQGADSWLEITVTDRLVCP